MDWPEIDLELKMKMRKKKMVFMMEFGIWKNRGFFFFFWVLKNRGFLVVGLLCFFEIDLEMGFIRRGNFVR